MTLHTQPALITCPACKGAKLVARRQPDTPSVYTERAHPRVPCGACNGTGIKCAKGADNDGGGCGQAGDGGAEDR